MGCGSGMTCWRRLRMWTVAGVWPRVQQFLLDHLRFLDKIDFKRFLIDSSHLRARGAGAKTGPSPVDRRKPGSKIHVLTDGTGIPIKIHLTAGNRNDVEETIPLIDDVPPIAGHVGRPRCRPDRLQGDRGYDDEGDRAELRQRHIEPIIPKRRSAHGSGLGKFRWFIERTISWLRQFPRVRVRTDRDPTNYVGWLSLATIFICHRIAFPRLC
jgi:transposase